MIWYYMALLSVIMWDSIGSWCLGILGWGRQTWFVNSLVFSYQAWLQFILNPIWLQMQWSHWYSHTRPNCIYKPSSVNPVLHQWECSPHIELSGILGWGRQVTYATSMLQYSHTTSDCISFTLYPSYNTYPLTSLLALVQAPWLTSGCCYYQCSYLTSIPMDSPTSPLSSPYPTSSTEYKSFTRLDHCWLNSLAFNMTSL